MTSPNETTLVQKAGAEAPDFSLDCYPQGHVTLSALQGRKNVILAFYPKDDTPGCTKEMCAFSEDLSKFQAVDTEVFGISCDGSGDHEKFAGKYSLKQQLLVDKDGLVAKAYGVLRDGKTMANRVLFVIDKTGVIRHVHEGMPDNAQLLEWIKAL